MHRPSHPNPIIEDGLAPAGAERLLALLVALFVLVVGFEAGTDARRGDPARAPAAAVSALDDAGIGAAPAATILRAVERSLDAPRQAKGADPAGLAPQATRDAAPAFTIERAATAQDPPIAQPRRAAHRPRGPPIA